MNAEQQDQDISETPIGGTSSISLEPGSAYLKDNGEKFTFVKNEDSAQEAPKRSWLSRLWGGLKRFFWYKEEEVKTTVTNTRKDIAEELGEKK